jgi:streptogramin lyase
VRRTATLVLVAAVVVIILRSLFGDNSRAALFAAKQAAVGPGARAEASREKLIIQEWDVPTRNSHPHDPAVAPDGSLWYTGQMSNTLGRLDTRTGKIQEFRLKTPNSGPHALVADRNGNIWFTRESQRVYRQARSSKW